VGATLLYGVDGWGSRGSRTEVGISDSQANLLTKTQTSRTALQKCAPTYSPHLVNDAAILSTSTFDRWARCSPMDDRQVRGPSRTGVAPAYWHCRLRKKSGQMSQEVVDDFPGLVRLFQPWHVAALVDEGERRTLDECVHLANVRFAGQILAALKK
jgi:hypothetical protein